MIENLETLPRLPNEWGLQIKLRCASLCGFGLRPRVTNGLLTLRDVTLLELYLYLHGRARHAGLNNVIHTEYEYNTVVAAYIDFYKLLLVSSRNERSPSEKLAWIVPDDYLKSSSRIRRSRATRILSGITQSFEDPLSVGSDMKEWLPWMSLSIVNCLRLWRSPRINSLRRAIFKLAADLDNRTNSFYPWTSECPREVRKVPIRALYQYEPTSLTLGTLRVFEDLGLTSVNDLRCLHPDAVASAKMNGRPLTKLYQRLQRQLSRKTIGHSTLAPSAATPQPSVSLTRTVQRFNTCRWQVKLHEDTGYCSHRDVLAYAGQHGFNPESWCPDCAFYKTRRKARATATSRHRQ